jgi:hypothetical protein
VQGYHAVITEPEPGCVLVESEKNSGTVTTFRVDPRDGGKGAYVTISSTVPVPGGLIGKVQGWMTERTLKPIYVKELKVLNEYATK